MRKTFVQKCGTEVKKMTAVTQLIWWLITLSTCVLNNNEEYKCRVFCPHPDNQHCERSLLWNFEDLQQSSKETLFNHGQEFIDFADGYYKHYHASRYKKRLLNNFKKLIYDIQMDFYAVKYRAIVNSEQQWIIDSLMVSQNKLDTLAADEIDYYSLPEYHAVYQSLKSILTNQTTS